MRDIAKAAAFWRCFAEHRRQIEALLLSDPLRAFLLLEKEVLEIDPRLRVEIGPGQTEENCLVISPAGNLELLPLTTALVAAAPPMPGWQFLPAKPRKEFDRIRFRMADGSHEVFFVEDFRFRLHAWEDTRFELHLFHRCGSFSGTEGYSIGYALIDALLGEESVMRHIARLEMRSADPTTFSELRVLSELPEFLSTW